MGGCLFCISSTTSSARLKKMIRVVHLNGYVEEFEDPITVVQLLGINGSNPSKSFVCTQAQLLMPGSTPLKPDAQLRLGHVYFLIPYHVPMKDLAPIAKKLTAIAKTRSGPRSTSKSHEKNKNSVVEADFSMQKSSKSMSWRPILTTIRENSVNEGSESQYVHNYCF